jgi:hypothetical protein
MSDYVAIEFDALTGQTIEREFTAEEIEQFEAAVSANQAEQEAKAAARASALAKLAELGLTEEEVAAL